MKRLGIGIVTLLSVLCTTFVYAGGDYDPDDFVFSSIKMLTSDGLQMIGIDENYADRIQEDPNFAAWFESGNMTYQQTTPEGYDKEAYTLTLENVHIKGDFVDQFMTFDWWAGNGELYINLVGENVIEEIGMIGGSLLSFRKADLDESDEQVSFIFVGEGSLTIKAADKNAMVFGDDVHMAFEGNEIFIETNESGIITSGSNYNSSITVRGATLGIQSKNGAIVGLSSLMLFDCSFANGYLYDDNRRSVVTEDGDDVVNCTIAPSIPKYGLKINDKELTSRNLDKFNRGEIEGFSGRVEVLEEDGTTNFVLTNIACQSIETPENIQTMLFIEGECAITNPATDGIGLYIGSKGSCTLKTNTQGKLTIEADYGVRLQREAYSYIDLTISENVQLIVNNATFGVLASYVSDGWSSASVYIEGGSRVEINATYTSENVVNWYWPSSEMAITTLAYYDKDTHQFGFFDENNTKVVIENVEKQTPFLLNNVQLNEKNFNLIPTSIMTGVSVNDENDLVLENARIQATLGAVSSAVIILKGSNTVVGKDYGLHFNKSSYLNIRGDGMLRIEGNKSGIYFEKNAKLNLHTTTVIVKSAGEGISSVGDAVGSVRVVNSSLTVVPDLESPAIIGLKEFELIDTRVAYPEDVNYGTFGSETKQALRDEDGNPVKGRVSVVPYWGLFINGVEITRDGEDIQVGQSAGKIRFQYEFYESSVLTLENVTIDGDLGIESSLSDLSIICIGQNEISVSEGAAVRINKGNLAIDGHQLDLHAPKGIVASKNKEEKNLYLDKCYITVQATDTCVGGFKSIKLDKITLYSPAEADIYGGDVVNAFYEVLKNATVEFAPSYDITVNGVKLDPDKTDNQVGQTSGKIWLDKYQSILYMENLQLTGNEGIVFKSIPNIQIVNKGKTSITVNGANGLVFDPALDESYIFVQRGADDQFSLSAKNAVELNEAELVVFGSSFTFSGTESAVVGNETALSGTFQIVSNTTVRLHGDNRTPVYNVAHWVMEDEKVENPKGAAFSSADGDFRKDGASVANDLLFTPDYYLRFGNSKEELHLSLENELQFPDDGTEYIRSGKVFYYHAQRTLVLQDAVLLQPIRCTYPNLTIRVEGTDSIFGKDDLIYMPEYSSLRIEGAGSLALVGSGKNPAWSGIESGSITLDNTNVSLKNVEYAFVSYAFFSDAVVSIIHSNVDISATACAFVAQMYGATVRLELTECSFFNPADAYWKVYDLMEFGYLMANDELVNECQIRTNTTDIDEISTQELPEKAQKLFRNGQLFILLPDGSTYNMQGIRLQ